MTLIKTDLKTWIILGIILIFSLFLRVYDLSSIPLGFHIDEASLGYNGYSLLLTGKDESNNPLPLYINMFGDERPSGYHYLTILPIKFLGLNEFATRLPGALAGSLTVIPFFFLSEILFRNKKISLLSAFLLSIAPWSVVLSRASAETIVALFLIITGYVLFISGLQTKRMGYVFTGSLFLILSFFFYHTPRVFVPLLLFATLLYLYPTWKKFLTRQKIYLLGAFLVVSFVSFALVFLIKGGTGRFSEVNIFGDPHVKLVMEEQIRESGVMHTPVLVTRLIHNKVVDYSLALVSNYLDYFSGQFLFIQGGLPIWYKVPSMGLIYLIELPFILIGLFYLFSSKDVYHKLPLIWLIIAPITAAFTTDDIPNLQRAIVMFPMIDLIAAYGFIKLVERFPGIKYKTVLGIFSLLLVFNFTYFSYQYFIQSQVHQNWYRYEGFSSMMDIVKSNYNKYDKIVITKSFGGIYPLVLFYMKYNPSTYQKEGSPKDPPDGGFGKFIFASAACPSIDKSPKIALYKNALFIDNGTCPDNKTLMYRKYSFILRKDQTKAFRIVYD